MANSRAQKTKQNWINVCLVILCFAERREVEDAVLIYEILLYCAKKEKKKRNRFLTVWDGFLSNWGRV
jgi:hypothetical protein